MSDAVMVVIAAASGLLVAVLGMASQLAALRNERNMTKIEVEILEKLPDKDGQTAMHLTAMIEARVEQWHRRAFKTTAAGEEVERRPLTFLNFMLGVGGVVATSAALIMVLVLLLVMR